MTLSVYELDDNISAPPEHGVETAETYFRDAERQYNETKTGYLTTTPSSTAYLPARDFIVEPNGADLAEKARLIADQTTAATATEDPKKTNKQLGHHAAAARILQRQFAATSQLGLVEYVLHHTNSGAFFKGQPGKKYASLDQILQYPYIVGSVHVSSTTLGTRHPIIDPRYYQGKAGSMDAEVMLHGLQFGDKIMKTGPLSSVVARRLSPPEDDEAKSKLDWASWIRDNTVTDWHPVGTCAMLPLNGGGVVDHRLRVYGTKNLRVIDASVFPLHISAHIQATIYAIAEKGADIIKGDRDIARKS